MAAVGGLHWEGASSDASTASKREPLRWCVIFYARFGDHDGDRTLVGPYMNLHAAIDACRQLQDFGDAEVRRVCSFASVQAVIDSAVTSS